MNIKKLIGMLFALLLFAGVMNAQTTFYVNNQSGDDANPGTSLLPKKTVSSALIAAPSGSIISVAYTGINYVEGAITVSGKSYTFTSTGGNTPVFSGAALNVGPAAGSANITAASVASPTVITAAGHNLTTGDVVYISGTGNVDVDGQNWTVTVLTANTYSIAYDNTLGATFTGKAWPVGTVTFTSAFEFDGGVNLYNGTLDGGGFVTVKGGVLRTELGSVLSSALVYGAAQSVVYDDIIAGASTITTGNELSTSTTLVNNINVNKTSTSILTLKLDQNRTMNGVLTTVTTNVIDLDGFILNIKGTSAAHAVGAGGSVTDGTLKFTMTLGDATLTGGNAAVTLPDVIATSTDGTVGTPRVLTLAVAQTVNSLYAQSNSSIVANAITTVNVALNTTDVITNSSNGVITMNAVTTINGNVLLSATGVATSTTALITFGTAGAITVNGDVTNSVGIALSAAAVTGAGIISFPDQANVINGNVSISSTANLSGSAVTATNYTGNGQIIFNNAATNLTITGLVTNAATSTATTGVTAGTAVSNNMRIVFMSTSGWVRADLGFTNSSAIPAVNVTGLATPNVYNGVIIFPRRTTGTVGDIGGSNRVGNVTNNSVSTVASNGIIQFGTIPATYNSVTLVAAGAGTATLTIGAHSLQVGDVIRVNNIAPADAALNTLTFTLTAVTATTISFADGGVTPGVVTGMVSNASQGTFYGKSVSQGAYGKGGDITFGDGLLNLSGSIINDRTDTGADIIVPAGFLNKTHTIAGSVKNNGLSLISIDLTTNDVVGITGSLESTSATGSVTFPNAGSGAINVGSINIIAGTISVPATHSANVVVTNSITTNGGSLSLLGSGNITAKTLALYSGNILMGSRGTFTVNGSSHQIGAATTSPIFTGAAVLTFTQPIPVNEQIITIGNADPTYTGSLTINNTSSLAGPYVKFVSLGGTTTPANFYVLHDVTFATSGSSVINIVSLDNVRLNVGKHSTNSGPGTANFQNTSGYVTANTGRVLMSANDIVQTVNAGAIDAGATFGAFGVDNVSDAIPYDGVAEVTVGVASVFTGDFFLAYGEVSNANITFTGVDPWPTIFRTEGIFITGAPAVTAGTMINVTFYGGDKTAAFETPAGAATLNNLSVETTNGAVPGQGVVKLGANTTVNGLLNIIALQNLYTQAFTLTLKGANASVYGNLVDNGTTLVQLARATGTTFTGTGSLPSLQVNNGSAGNQISGIPGLVSQGFGADNALGGGDDAFTTYDGNITYAGGADLGSSLKVTFTAVAAGNFDALTLSGDADETFTLGANAVMRGSITHPLGTIALGDYKLTQKGGAFAMTGGANITSNAAGALEFVTNPTTLTITAGVAGTTPTIAANVNFNAPGGIINAPATTNLTITGNVNLMDNAAGTLGTTVNVPTTKTLTLGSGTVTVSENSLFTTTGTGVLKLDVAAPNTTMLLTVPAATSVGNLTVSDNVTLAGDVTGTGGLFTVTTAFVHTAGLLTFGTADLQVNGTFTRSGGTYAGDGWLIYGNGDAGTGFQHSSTVAAGPMTINNFKVITATMTLKNARDFNVVKGLWLFSGSIDNSVLAGTTGYVKVGDATNVPMITVNSSNNILTNALTFVNANADYTFTGNKATISTKVFPAQTSTVPRNVEIKTTLFTVTSVSAASPAVVTTGAAHGLATGDVVLITGTGDASVDNKLWPVTVTGATTFSIVYNNAVLDAAGFVSVPTIFANSIDINGNLFLNQGVLTWDTPYDVKLATGSTITRNATGALVNNADSTVPAGTFTAANVNLVYTGIVGLSGLEFSAPTVINNLTLGLPNPSTVTLNTAKTIAGLITINGANSVLTLAQNTTFSLGQTLIGTITVTAPKVLTLLGVTTLGNVNGDVTTDFDLTINGNHTAGTITAGANVTVGTAGAFAVTSNLNLIGATNVNLTVPTAGATIGTLTLNKTNSQNTVTLVGGKLVTTLIDFTKGLLVVTGNNYVQIAQGAVNTPAKGFVRNVAFGDLSHVVGNVRTMLKAGIIEAFGRNEFPVGSTTAYCPVAITTLNPGGSISLGVNVTASYHPEAPTGITGLPIANGVSAGVDIARYASLYWAIKSDVSIGNTRFDLELTSPSFADYDDINNVRIIRRMGVITDLANSWTLQGSQYNNFVTEGVPTVTNVQTAQGLSTAGAIFTYGMKTRLAATAFTAQTIGTVVGGAYHPVDVDLTGHFTGPEGTTLIYTASSANTGIATTAIVDNILTISGVADGATVVTVRATDQNNDFITATIAVTVNSLVGNEKNAIPTEYAVYQNYPNPFNPTTAIKYALPKESQVTVKVYNMLAQEVAVLVNEVKSAGYHTINFNANGLASGRYIAVIKAGEFNKTIKMNLLK